MLHGKELRSMNLRFLLWQIRSIVCVGMVLLAVAKASEQRARAAQQVSNYTSRLNVAISTGFNFAALPSNWVTNFGMGGALVSGDFNGDGATDIAAIGDPCPTERARLQELQNELRQLSQIPGVKAEIKGVVEHNQQVLQRWHRDHDAEVNQLTTRLGSPQCRLNSVRVALSTGHGFNPSADLWISNFVAPDAVLTGALLTGDFNGDGKTDIAVYDVATKGWHVALSTGHSFDPSAGFWIRGFGRSGIMLTGDFNGDGKTDIAAVGDPCERERAELQALQDNLRGLEGPGGPADVKARLIERWHEQHDAEVDRLTRVLASAQCPLSAVHVALSTGHSFNPSAGLWIINFGGPGAVLTGDFNGDGKADLAGWNPAIAGWHVALSTGHSFDPSAGFSIRDFGNPDVMLTGDFNGDGKTDIAAWDDPAAAWHVALSSGSNFNPGAGLWITNFGAPVLSLQGTSMEMAITGLTWQPSNTIWRPSQFSRRPIITLLATHAIQQLGRAMSAAARPLVWIRATNGHKFSIPYQKLTAM
jgi:FG-GAP-like repeat